MYRKQSESAIVLVWADCFQDLLPHESHLTFCVGVLWNIGPIILSLHHLAEVVCLVRETILVGKVSDPYVKDLAAIQSVDTATLCVTPATCLSRSPVTGTNQERIIHHPQLAQQPAIGFVHSRKLSSCCSRQYETVAFIHPILVFPHLVFSTHALATSRTFDIKDPVDVVIGVEHVRNNHEVYSCIPGNLRTVQTSDSHQQRPRPPRHVSVVCTSALA
mmetsp:Transcript_9348/g.21604  ORF Transcript_9348/g.21604 Transcript_9348/m.21604 type:complete len:218 (+) Transcript_9348:795-1448(+)